MRKKKCQSRKGKKVEGSKLSWHGTNWKQKINIFHPVLKKKNKTKNSTPEGKCKNSHSSVFTKTTEKQLDITQKSVNNGLNE